MTRPADIPEWAHAVENIGGVWRCSGRTARLNGERCGFATPDLQAAVSHANANQYEWLHAKPIDTKVRAA